MDVEAEIHRLKKSIIERYEKDVQDMVKAFNEQNTDNLQRLEEKKNALIKELDDRLALVRQFPSVLDADRVVSIEHECFFTDGPDEVRVDTRLITRLEKGKWKILVMAKKLE